MLAAGLPPDKRREIEFGVPSSCILFALNSSLICDVSIIPILLFEPVQSLRLTSVKYVALFAKSAFSIDAPS